MVLPLATAAVIAAMAAMTAGSKMYEARTAKKNAARKAHETKRETKAGMLDEALERSAEREANQLSSKKKLGQARSNSSMNTADIVRGAFKV